jgi:SAM-dependent methyltransferase
LAVGARAVLSYHSSRFVKDAKRDVVWQALWQYYFSKIINPDFCVLDLGAGYGSFINHVVARRRIALDTWLDMPLHLALDVEAEIRPAADLGFLSEASVDFAFASNLFEHMTQGEFARVLECLRPKLAAGGTLNILQPNYRYAMREYFDDYTHVSIYSHVSLADFLTAHGYDVIDVMPRFLPLTVKSRLPVSRWLVGAYLNSPVKPLGKQMFIRARARR